MRALVIILQLFINTLTFAQPGLPFYYEKNLPLYGAPRHVEEYYYEYHTQVKAHYYNHEIEYDSLGRVKQHKKSNVGLCGPEDIPPAFQGIIDPRPVTITYTFKYHNEGNKLSRFSRHWYQEEVGTMQQDEEWTYDSYGMLTAYNFWEVQSDDTILKNPSERRIIFRDISGKVRKIEKYTYSFANRGVILSEISQFDYQADNLDTIHIFKISNGSSYLQEKRYNLSFHRNDPYNTDSVLLESYRYVDRNGDTALCFIDYDQYNRKVSEVRTSTLGDTLSLKEWKFEKGKTIQTIDNFYVLEIYYDETGYERYREEFEGGYSLAVPADFNTRIIEEGKITRALLEIWDPVALFYRKDTEYIFEPETITTNDYPVSMISRNVVYPNPSSGVIFLKKADEIEKLELVSMDGTVTSLPVTEKVQLNLQKGIYLLLIFYVDNSVSNTKLLIDPGR